MQFRKSTHCSSGACVEVAFQRSSHCADGNCVEVDLATDGVAVRDSKNPGTILRFDRAEWAAFVAGVKAGEFEA